MTSRWVPRFSPTERALHWLHAAGFAGMAATGLTLYVPTLATTVGNRPLMKALHLGIALAWMLAVALVALLGDRGALRATLAEIDRFDDDDWRWLRGRPAPQSRFNAGQKLHAIAQAAIATLFVFSGTLLWLAEDDARFRGLRPAGLHDTLMYVSLTLVAGHVLLAVVWPATRPALRGMVRGTVPADWARAHHAKWQPRTVAAAAPSPRALVAAALLVAVTAVVAVAVIGPGLR